MVLYELLTFFCKSIASVSLGLECLKGQSGLVQPVGKRS